MVFDSGTLFSILNTNNAGQYIVAKTILGNAGIVYYTKNENINFIAKPAGYFEILVEDKDVHNASEALKDLMSEVFLKSPEEVQNDEKLFRNIITAILLFIIVIFVPVIL